MASPILWSWTIYIASNPAWWSIPAPDVTIAIKTQLQQEDTQNLHKGCSWNIWLILHGRLNHWAPQDAYHTDHPAKTGDIADLRIHRNKHIGSQNEETKKNVPN